MKKVERITIGIVVLLLKCAVLFAQEKVLTSGNEISGQGGTLSYSVGQIFYLTSESSGYSISESIHQPYEISVLNSYVIPEIINLTCNVFPNPAEHYLKLNFNDPYPEQFSALSYLLYNSSGRLLIRKDGLAPDNYIDLTEYEQGAYLLSVTFNNHKLKIFKIIKH